PLEPQGVRAGRGGVSLEVRLEVREGPGDRLVGGDVPEGSRVPGVRLETESALGEAPKKEGPSRGLWRRSGCSGVFYGAEGQGVEPCRPDDGLARMIRLRVKRGREESLKRRHPWLFSGAVASADGDGSDGLAVVVDD